MKSNEARSGSPTAGPPARQLSGPQLQLISCGCKRSSQGASAEWKAGAITTASSSACARKAAAVAVAEYRSALRRVPCTRMKARRTFGSGRSSAQVL
jgi:hypothetical protein